MLGRTHQGQKVLNYHKYHCVMGTNTIPLIPVSNRFRFDVWDKQLRIYQWSRICYLLHFECSLCNHLRSQDRSTRHRIHGVEEALLEIIEVDSVLCWPTLLQALAVALLAPLWLRSIQISFHLSRCLLETHHYLHSDPGDLVHLHHPGGGCGGHPVPWPKV